MGNLEYNYPILGSVIIDHNGVRKEYLVTGAHIREIEAMLEERKCPLIRVLKESGSKETCDKCNCF